MFDVVDLDRINACGISDGRIVATRVESISKEEYLGLFDTGQLGQAFHAVRFIDTCAGDVYRSRAPNSNGDIRKDRLKVFLNQATLLLLRIPALLGTKGRLLSAWA